MNSLKNTRYFKFFILLFLSSLAFSTPSETQIPSTPSEPPIPHTMNYDYLRENGSDFFSQGVVTYKGDFIQTSSGKVITQRKEGILYWEDIPFALPPVGNLRWKAPIAFVSEDFNVNPKENNLDTLVLNGSNANKRLKYNRLHYLIYSIVQEPHLQMQPRIQQVVF